MSVAPMMEWTTRHYRYLARLISPRTVLYTEMVVDQTLVNVHKKGKSLSRWLAHHPEEEPLVLQLGGNDPDRLATSAKLARDLFDYREINLNVGCPSAKVCTNEFGARLMMNPGLVGDIVSKMKEVSGLPITVKCRLGVDQFDDYEFVKTFIDQIPECDHFIIHARKCLLNGLSTSANRSVPPLNYERVYKLCEDYPDKSFTLNGGVTSVESMKRIMELCPNLHGIMIGREAYHNPCILAVIDHVFFKHPPVLTRRNVIEQYVEYGVQVLEEDPENIRIMDIMKPLSNMFRDLPNAKLWRKSINQSASRKEERIHDVRQVVSNALDLMNDQDLDAPIALTLE